MEPRSDPKPFDERAALAELERVREQIQAYRAQRRDIQDEFGRFTRSFKNAEAAAASTAAAPEAEAPPARQLPPPLPAMPPPAPPLQDEVSSAPIEPPVHAAPPEATAVEPFLPAPGPAQEALPPPAPGADPPVVAPQPTASRAPAVAAVVVVVALLALFAAWMFSGPTDQPSSVTTSPPPAPAAVEPTPAATPPAAAAAPSNPGSELTTIRLVWMRVLVDGQRVVEREVPAGTRIPLAAKESIVIRTGDAGAVRLTLAGEDQGFLGREGDVVTRTFTVPTGRGAR